MRTKTNKKISVTMLETAIEVQNLIIDQYIDREAENQGLTDYESNKLNETRLMRSELEEILIRNGFIY